MANPTQSSTITNLSSATALTGAEVLPIDQNNAGTLSTLKTSVSQLNTLLTASTALTGAETITLTTSATSSKKTTVAQFITQQTASTILTGTELFIISDGAATTKKTTLAQAVTQATAAGAQATGDLFYSVQAASNTNIKKYAQSQIVEFMNIYTGAGSANTYTITPSPAYAAYAAGMRFRIQVTNTNTAASTLNVNGLGPKNIFAYNAALLGGEMPNTAILDVQYDGTQFQLLNPNDSKGSFTLTLTGMSAGTTGTVNWFNVRGKLVNIEIFSDILGTSNATTMTGTGWPSSLIPATGKNVCYLAVRDASVGAIGGQIIIPNSGTTVTFSNALPIASGSLPRAWTNSGSKGLFIQTFSYTLD